MSHCKNETIFVNAQPQSLAEQAVVIGEEEAEGRHGKGTS